MYTSRQIANYFIKSSQKTGDELTPMKLLKLCYIAHGWHLGLFNTALLDETVFAWKYGPVVETVYHDFKKYRDSQISELYRDENCAGGYPMPDEKIFPFLDKVWDVYKGFDGVQLSALTHQPNTPWDIVWNQRGGRNLKSAPIPNDLIMEHYKSKLNNSSASH